MNILPRNTQLGTLNIVEIYEFFTMPALFLCRNDAGQAYIATWVDEYSDKNVWLYTAISDGLLAKLRDREFDLRDAFIGDAAQAVYQVTVYLDNAQDDTAVLLNTGDIDPDMAPLHGYRIDLSLLPSVVWDGVDQRTEVLVNEAEYEALVMEVDVPYDVKSPSHGNESGTNS